MQITIDKINRQNEGLIEQNDSLKSEVRALNKELEQFNEQEKTRQKSKAARINILEPIVWASDGKEFDLRMVFTNQGELTAKNFDVGVLFLGVDAKYENVVNHRYLTETLPGGDDIPPRGQPKSNFQCNLPFSRKRSENQTLHSGYLYVYATYTDMAETGYDTYKKVYFLAKPRA